MVEIKQNNSSSCISISPVRRKYGIGIYCIINTQNDKVYVGSTRTDFYQRIIEHRSSLRTERHGNSHLQSAFNLYGESAFVWKILESVDYNSPLERIDELEDFWCKELKSHKSDYGYNIRPIAPWVMVQPRNKKIFRLKSPSGDLVEVQNITQFCRDNNLNQPAFSRVLSGKRHITGGWSLFEPIRPQGKRGRSKELMKFSVVSPDGIVMHGVNGAEFARNHGLRQGSLWKLLSGKSKTYLGWKLYKPQT